MKINKKQQAEQLPYLAANDNAAFNEVFKAVVGKNVTMVGEALKTIYLWISIVQFTYTVQS